MNGISNLKFAQIEEENATPESSPGVSVVDASFDDHHRGMSALTALDPNANSKLRKTKMSQPSETSESKSVAPFHIDKLQMQIN